MTSIANLYREVAEYGTLDADYVEKQIHKIPAVPVVNRVEYLIKMAKDRNVFDIGASGPLAELIRQASRTYYSTDIVPGDAPNYYQIDLDRADSLPDIPGLELIIAGEVIEHLSNAGHFLDLIHRYDVPVILTTPNAFSAGADQFLRRGIENVNREHVAWYSYHTLKVLVERHRFRVVEWFWQNGQPITAEGLVFHLEPINGTD